MPQITCHQCGKEFKQPKPDSKYCSQTCYWASLRKSVMIICKYCGKSFEVLSRDARRRKYCSYSCNNKSRAIYPSLPKRQCPVCGKLFSPVSSKPGKYCSQKCYDIDRHQSALSNQKYICKICRGKFAPTQKTQQYCSRKCMFEDAKRRTKFICEVCDIEFIDRKTSKRRFCSNTCRGKWYSEYISGKNNPNWKGGRASYYGPNWTRQSRKARKRDKYTCRVCGLHQRFPRLDVHHIISLKDFNGDWKIANCLDNLVALCIPCHNRIERGIIPCP